MNGIIVSDDARYNHLQAYLQDKGFIFDPEKILDFAIFPFKQAVDEKVYPAAFFAGLEPACVVFSGVRSSYLAEKCAAYGLAYYPMMEDAGVAVKNAVPTSEGVIAYLVQNMQCTIAGSKMLVIGYGTCGRDLARRLTALGAGVYALVRNREKECAAQADGITPIYLHQLEQLEFSAIINTVPSTVLTHEMLDRLGDALLVDIASAPYGFDMEYAKTLNPKSALLPAIPGKYAIQTAGEVLGEYVAHVLM